MFAPEGMYKPCGMFTITHLLAFFICISLVIITFALTKNISYKTLRKIVLSSAIFVTLMEIIKIGYKFFICAPYNENNYNRYNLANLKNYDTWMPLFFCSLLIYALWVSLSRNEHIKNLGESYLMLGAFGGGFAFLIFPTTSLQMVPIWHFESIHSLLFHCIMCYISLMYLYQFSVNISRFKYYITFFIIFAVPSLIFNTFTGANLMMLSVPYITFMPHVNSFFTEFSPLYTVCCILAYIFVPTSLSLMINKVIFKHHHKELEESELSHINN